jgi:hypothetical protein
LHAAAIIKECHFQGKYFDGLFFRDTKVFFPMEFREIGYYSA